MNYNRIKRYMLTILGGIILTIYYVDIPLANLIKNTVNQTTVNIFKKITIFGSFTSIVIINILFLLYFLIRQKLSKTKEIKEKYANRTKIMLYAALSQSITAIIIQLLKFIFGRMRPYYYLSQTSGNSFTYFTFNNDFVSFPSGHSAGIWALVTCLIILFKRNRYSLLLIIPAVLVSISRLVLNVHFLSDIFVGGLLGITISATLMKFFRKNYLDKSNI